MSTLGIRVLVVDDEAWSRELTSLSLPAPEFEVHATGSATDALHQLHVSRPAVSIVDLLMPEMDGIELVRAMRASGYDGAIIVLTAVDASANCVEALEAGADDYMAKPFDEAVLRARVAAQLRKRVVLDKPEERFQVGQVVAAKYLLVDLIGEGAFGAVFRATHLHLDMPVAFKVLRQEYAHDQDMHADFMAESALATRIRHRNVVRVLDADISPGGRPYCVAELVDGEDLADLLQLGPRPLSEVHRLVMAFAGALAAIHRAGVLHRDIKPSNIFVHYATDGPIFQIGDFGLAIAASRREAVASTARYGTEAYMAPERLAGHPYGPPSDVYSAGIVVAEALSQRRLDREGRLPPLPMLPAAAVRLLEDMVSPEPAVRPAPEALWMRWQHAFGRSPPGLLG